MKNLKVKIANGEVAVRNHGDNGKDILFVHGSGQNLEVWEPLAKLLENEYRLWSFDTRGHGQTTLKSENATQYWKDIDRIISELNIKPILLVGHSIGGFSISAYTVWKHSNIPIMILDGFVLDKYNPNAKIPKETLWEMFRYGWKTSAIEKEDYIKNQIEKSFDNKDFNYGIPKELIAKVLNRAFSNQGNQFLRKPTFEEMEIIAYPSENEKILPDVNLYNQIDSPIAFVLATKGLYYNRKTEVEDIISQKTNRFYYEIDSTHNLPMTEPNEIKKIIIKFLSKI
ncbi:MAG: hypothetical protein CSA42_03760 [Gammaproteobacteria bacterium]|nr:MAG: hypothetical protein CSA42_03760 [Gammaproteobacteria bacterium]